MKESYSDVLLEILMKAARSGAPADQIVLLQTKLDELIDLKNEIIAQQGALSEKLLKVQEAEHVVMLKSAELTFKLEKHEQDKKDMEVLKFAVKKEKEAAEALSQETNNKIGDAEAKLKRLEFEDSRIKGLEQKVLSSRKKLEEAVSLLKKTLEETL